MHRIMTIREIIISLLLILFSIPLSAQTYRNLEELQNISIENSMRKRQEKKEAEKPEQKAA